jgi:sugar O-acyltransferase (sialic acid O-acetyltransferase NeuD family)
MQEVKRLIVLGATGGCLDVVNTVQQINKKKYYSSFEIIGILDDKIELHGKTLAGCKVLGAFSLSRKYLDQECYFATAIGSEKNYFKRHEIIKKLDIPDEKFPNIIHPSSIISDQAYLGYGCIIHQNVVVSMNVTVGNYVVLLPNTVVNHGAKIGDYTIINSATSLAGGVVISSSCYIGAGSLFRQGVFVGRKSLVGMGAVVINDVCEDSTVVGNPAKLLNKK